MRKSLKIWAMLLLMILIVGCKTVPTTERTPFYELVEPPTRPVLQQLMDEPLNGAIHNMNLLMTWGQRWELWYEQYKAYESR
jgi:hypothetical protein